MILTIFPPLLCPRANCSRLSSLICSFLKSNLNDLLPSLFTKGQSERFAQVAQNKGATVSDSLTSLFKKERKCDSLSKKEQNALSLFRSQKSGDSLKILMSKFPTLGRSLFNLFLTEFQFIRGF